MNFALAVAIAVQFWTVRGVEVPCRPNVVTGPATNQLLMPVGVDGLPADMGTITSTCTIYISTYANAFRNDMQMRTKYCMEIAHEVGHLAGLQHDDDYRSVMYGKGVYDVYAPWYCEHFKEFVRRRAAEFSRRQAATSRSLRP